MTFVYVSFDPQADAGYVRFVEGRIDGSEEVAPGLIIDFSADDEPMGLEVLGVRGRVGEGDVDSYLRGLAEGWLSARQPAAIAAE